MAHLSVFDVNSLQDRRFWMDRLVEVSVDATLPLDQPRPAVRTPRPAHIQVPFESDVALPLARLAKGSRFLRYAVVLAALALCLRRYGAATVIGSPPLAREGASGANAVPIVVDVDETASFKDLLVATREALKSAYAHDGYPCGRLIEDLGLGAVEDRCPLYNVAFADPSLHRELADLGEDVTVTLRDDGLDIAFDRRLFARPTIARFARHLTCLLTDALARMAIPMARLKMLDDADFADLAAWNATRAAPAPDLAAMFAAAVAAAPDAVAVASDGVELSYRALNARANRLAHWLRAQGGGPARPVGLCLSRSATLIEAVLALVKVGAPMLPLDPGYPSARLALMLADSGAGLVLSERGLADIVETAAADGSDTWVVCVEDIAPDLATRPDDDAATGADPDDLLYLLYTSGSTGVPKGVAMPRRPVANLAAWQIAAGAGQAPRTLQFASLNFDVSFQEIFTTLCAGGTLVMIGEDTRRDRAAFVRHVAANRIERLFVPVVALRELAKGAEETGVVPAELAEIIVAGEQLQLSDAIVALVRQTECRMANHYGPTETHVMTSHEMSGAPTRWPVLPPIGKPIANCRCYVLDDRLRPVPPGATGELFLAGDCLARGYWARAGATAQRFLPDPFGPPGARMYRSGDIGRHLADGSIAYLGRADQQLKIRGYRVEPGEIETVLARHSRVREAFVMADPRAPSSRLVAFVVPDGEAPDAAELTAFLKDQLPPFMIPNLFVAVSHPPLTASGKVDRKALAAMEIAPAQKPEDYVAPRSETEEALAAIWAELLNVERVGVTDDFFALGGHSLLVAQIVARVKQAFGYEMPAHLMFDVATVADMAGRIDAARDDAELDALLADMEGLSSEEIGRMLDQGPAGE